MNPHELCRIWDLHHDRLLLISRSIRVDSGSAAEDAVQEAFLELSRQPTLPCDVVAWMVRVVRNRLLSWHRTGQRRQERETKHCETNCNNAWFDSNDADTAAIAQELTSALRALDDSDRQIVVMHHWGEMTFAQIAETTESSRSSVHRRYQAALTLLRERLAPETFNVQPR